jgi:hypothetical protein
MQMQEFWCRNALAESAGYLHYRRMAHGNPIDKAIASLGGEDAFMRAVGIKRRTLFYWRADGIPAVRLKAVSEATGIPAHALRPDLFGAEAKSLADVAA